MALVWFDGFDHLASNQMTRKYNTFGGNVVSGSSTRFNYGQAISMTGAVQEFVKVTSAASQAWRIGFAFQITAFGSAPNLIYLRDSATNQCAVSIQNLRLVGTGAGGTTLATSTRSLQLNAWYHFEWYVVVENSLSSGHFIVKINGEEWLNISSGDTQATANASADRFGSISASSTTILMDDLFVFHEAVTSSPTFDGDMRVMTLTPSGNGNYSQFDGSDGNSTDNYLLVDETTPNDDTDYVESDVVSEKDSYAMGNLSVTPAAIKGVQISATIKKGDSGSRTGKTFFRISGTDYESSAFAPGTSYNTQVYMAENSPATATAWTESEVNALEAGVKVES